MSENMSVLQALWNAFLKRWPKEKIKALTLAEYVSVNDQDTFTYWLETKTRQLGSIQGNTSAKFGIYKRNGKANGQSGIGHGEVYSWRTKYGEDEQSVFDYVKQNLIAIIEAVEQGDLERIELIDFSAMVKWKIAFLYQNQHKPCLINIFSKEMLDVLVDAEAKQSFPQLYSELIQLKGDRDLLQYGKESWQRANSKKKEIWQKQIFAKFQHVRVFSRHLNTWDDEVKTAFCELIEAAYQQNFDVFTTNMASGDMIRIGRKEIGADSAESIFATFKPSEQLIYSQRFKGTNQSWVTI